MAEIINYRLFVLIMQNTNTQAKLPRCIVRHIYRIAEVEDTKRKFKKVLDEINAIDRNTYPEYEMESGNGMILSIINHKMCRYPMVIHTGKVRGIHVEQPNANWNLLQVVDNKGRVIFNWGTQNNVVRNL